MKLTYDSTTEKVTVEFDIPEENFEYECNKALNTIAHAFKVANTSRQCESEIKRVRITSCSDTDLWYASSLGQEFDVYLVCTEGYKIVTSYGYFFINKEDCEVVK